MILSMLMPPNLPKFTEWTLRETIQIFHLSELAGGNHILSKRYNHILLKTPWIGYRHCMLK